MYYRITAIILITVFFAAMALTKFNHHVMDNKPFWEFE